MAALAVSRHALVLLWASLWLICSPGWGQDSLDVRARIIASPDSLDLPLHLTWGTQPASFDSAWHRIARSAAPSAWAEWPLGRAQLHTRWPRFADSLEIWMTADSSRLTLIVGRDTLQQAWSTSTSGCFPAVSATELTRWMHGLEDIPFESRRHDLTLRWLESQCLSVTHLGQLLDTFDDEARRLALIQRAQVVNPTALPSLADRFVSSRYRAAFTDWIPSEF